MEIAPRGQAGAGGAMASAIPIRAITPAQGSIVIVPGSFNLRIGIAEHDEKPLVIPNCIAWRRSKPSSNATGESAKGNNHDDKMDVDTETRTPRITSQAMPMPLNGARAPPTDGRAKFMKGLDKEVQEAKMALSAAPESKRNALTEKNAMEILPRAQDANFEWTDINDEPKYIIGEEALYLDEATDPYNIYFPFRHGKINRSKFLSAEMALESIRMIWEYAIIKLEIPADKMQLFEVVLVISDSFDQADVVDMIKILLERIGVRAVFLAKESVCAATGAALTSCCVVDIGFSKISVACVEEMDIIEASSFTVPYGGENVSELLLYLLKNFNLDESFFKYQDADMRSNMQDLVVMEEMKESVCHLKSDQTAPKFYEFLIRHKNEDTRLFRVNVGLAQIMAPFGLFHPEMLSFDPLDTPGNLPSSDTNAALFEVKTVPTQSALKKKTDPTFRPADHFAALPLQKAIMESVSSMETTPAQQRMYARILLVGGGAAIPGLQSVIEDKVFDELPSDIERVEVVPIQTGPTPADCSWHGAALFATQTPREFWIERKRWMRYGVNLLRERLPFLWDNPLNRKIAK